ncbi:hypothetical protein [Pseudoduganella albidiflava]|uniref:Uncharacterized protein n=1 Tax=Pseudoduganella albidiflava TaxID=321983 RepID=A0A411WXT7_9BURK|nr:hypothetical protein [Pseudoduganella albidiflava]QBI01511.1 hypothetical protein EYF70_12110 [Pseudoduganella albidiflava]GGY35181.1 hypothetical protein GCM10007387_16440 [Pseudoduganella albidiflava]
MTLERRVSGQGNLGGKPHDRRSNPALAAVVDQAIRYDAERGAALAWAYLAQHGLPPETILRVLAAPVTGQRPRRDASSTLDGATFHA